jgi:hypothetical protein
MLVEGQGVRPSCVPFYCGFFHCGRVLARDLLTTVCQAKKSCVVWYSPSPFFLFFSAEQHRYFRSAILISYTLSGSIVLTNQMRSPCACNCKESRHRLKVSLLAIAISLIGPTVP